MNLCRASAVGILGVLAQECRRRYVAAGLHEAAVVEHDAGDRLASGGCVEALERPLRGHISVALERQHEQVRMRPLDAGGDGGRPAVQRLNDVDVKEVTD